MDTHGTCTAASEATDVVGESSTKPACFSIHSSARRSPEKEKCPPSISRAVLVLATTFSSVRQRRRDSVRALAASSPYSLVLRGSS
jgi:hypothetical protein